MPSRRRGALLSCLALFLFTSVLYWLSDENRWPIRHPSHWPSYWYLAESFLEGRLGLTSQPGGLELLPGKGGLLYVANPPFPAFLCLPAVPLHLPQRLVACLVGALAVALALRKWGLWHALLLGLGTPLWYLSSVGSVWYFAQTVAVACSVAALMTRSALLSGLLLGAAYWSRYPMLGMLPILIYQHRERWAECVLGVGGFILANTAYNLLRFDHMTLGMIFGPPIEYYDGVAPFEHGLVSLEYVTSNLRVMFGAMPRLVDHFPWLIPSIGGTAAWVVTPALVLVRGPFSVERAVAWASVVLVMAPDLTHPTSGFTQFGYRYLMDAVPVLLCLMRPVGVVSWVLLAASVVANAWGIFVLNILRIQTF